MKFHYQFTKFEEIEILSDTTVFIPYVMLGHDQVKFKSVTEYHEHLLENSNKGTLFWFPFHGDSAFFFKSAIKVP